LLYLDIIVNERNLNDFRGLNKGLKWKKITFLSETKNYVCVEHTTNKLTVIWK